MQNNADNNSKKTRGERMVQSFFKNKDIASWYRSMSKSQEMAIDRLNIAIRDDGEQGTCYRVRKSLLTIGIKPVLPGKMLRWLIVLSRGSDLAFLYFMLEAHYKTKMPTEKPPDNYSDNEQLIMSAIMHLDLVFTIGALDRLLPPGYEEPELLSNRKKKSHTHHTNERRSTGFETMITTKRHRKSKVTFPYFQKQVRPKERHTRFRCPKPLYRVNFHFWHVGEKPNYQVKNENRWFADYQLQPATRVIKEVVNNAIDTLLNAACIKPKDAVGNGDDGSGSEKKEVKETPTLCSHHRKIYKQKNLIKDALKVAARDRCLNLINIETHENKLRKERIIKQLEQDIEWYTNKYKRIEQVELTKADMIYNNCGDSCEMCQALIKTPAEPLDMRVIYADKDIQRQATICDNTIKLISGTNAVFQELKPIKETTKEAPALNEQVNKNNNNDDNDLIIDDCATEKCKGKEQFAKQSSFKAKVQTLLERHKNIPRCVQLAIRNGSSLDNCIGECDEKGATHKLRKKNNKKKVSQDFFQATNLYEPHSFDYARIFRTKQLEVETQEEQNAKFIRKICVNALNEHSEAEELNVINKRISKPFLLTISQTVPETETTGKRQSKKFRAGATGKTKNEEEEQCFKPKSSNVTDNENDCVFLISNTETFKPGKTKQQYTDDDDSCSHSSDNVKQTLSLISNYEKTDVVEAIVKCAKAVWMKKLKNSQRDDALKSKNTDIVDGKSAEAIALKYHDVKYFDPNDVSLMENLLIDGMAVLRKDSRYVLASFPESHKLAVLREWIKRRYGKTYSYKDMLDSFDESLIIFRTIILLQNDLQKVQEHSMPEYKTSYNRIKEMRRLGNAIKSKYHETLNKTLLRYSTYCWFAMGTYLCPSGPPRDLFYSYMPAIEQDIHRIKPWNGECKDMKHAHEIRQAKEREKA